MNGSERLRKWVAPEKIRAVFLDAGNTLIFLDYEAIAEAIRESRIPIRSSRLERAEYEARRRADRKYLEGGARDAGMWILYFTWMMEAAGLAKDQIPEILTRLQSRHKESNLWRCTRPEIRTALEQIKTSGRKLAVISNADGTCRELLSRLDLLPFLDAVFDSTEVGVEKPAPAIFERALEALDVCPSETLHAGDLESVDVLGARRLGILPVLVDPYRSHQPRDFPVLRSVADLPEALEI